MSGSSLGSNKFDYCHQMLYCVNSNANTELAPKVSQNMPYFEEHNWQMWRLCHPSIYTTRWSDWEPWNLMTYFDFVIRTLTVIKFTFWFIDQLSFRQNKINKDEKVAQTEGLVARLWGSRTSRIIEVAKSAIWLANNQGRRTDPSRTDRQIDLF